MVPHQYLISVIIPVYNTAPYLQDCLDSVIQQNITDLELIIVDDGSTDGCDLIIEKYTSQHKFIKTFKLNRKRQGAARNLGLQHAAGRYISFVDSDDILPANALKDLYNHAVAHKSDMVIGSYQSFNQDKKWFEVPLHRKFSKIKTNHTNIFSLPELLEDMSVCNRLIKRSIIQTFNLQFPESYAGEDVKFMAELYLRCQRICIIPRIIYLYRRTLVNTSSTRISPRFFQNKKQTAMELSLVFADHSAKEIYPYLLRTEIRKLVGSRLAKVIKTLSKDEIYRIFAILHELCKQINKQDIYRSNDFNAMHKICILMLQSKEFSALFVFHKSLMKFSFLRLVKDKKTRFELSKLIPALYMLGLKKFFINNFS